MNIVLERFLTVISYLSDVTGNCVAALDISLLMRSNESWWRKHGELSSAEEDVCPFHLSRHCPYFLFAFPVNEVRSNRDVWLAAGFTAFVNTGERCIKREHLCHPSSILIEMLLFVFQVQPLHCGRHTMWRGKDLWSRAAQRPAEAPAWHRGGLCLWMSVWL